MRRLSHRPFFIRLFHWEYWSFNTVYFPIYIIWVGLCIRARSFFFFAASNPAIRNGGFLNESKKDIIPLIPAALHPRTVFFSVPADEGEVLRTLAAAGLGFPLFGKPDVGGRGRGIQKITNAAELGGFLRSATLDFHLQAAVPYEQEAGIFYYRYPGEARGRISGIVRKEFLHATGDGHSTLRELLQKDPRAILQWRDLEKVHGTFFGGVLAAGETLELVPYGNHARGAKFIDDSHLIDEALTNLIDTICRQIPEFHFGRLDIRYRSWEELRQGLHFSIIEVNGAGSEPTHIYDPAHSIFFAWKEIVRHWIILWRISRRNHRRGFPYLTTREGIAMFREDTIWSKRLATMGEGQLNSTITSPSVIHNS